MADNTNDTGGQGWRGPGRGRLGGPFAAGPAGECVCPVCGYAQEHVPGEPCNRQKCPNCGIGLVRRRD